MRPSSAKSKGRNLQKAAAKLIVEEFDELAADDVVSRPMGSPSADLIMSPLSQKIFPVSLECKNTKAQPGAPALEQAEYNKYPNTFAAVCWKPFRGSYSDPLVMMPLRSLLRLIKRIRNER